MFKWLKKERVYINRRGIDEHVVQNIEGKQYIEIGGDLYVLCADKVARKVDLMLDIIERNDANKFLDLEYKFWEK